MLTKTLLFSCLFATAAHAETPAATQSLRLSLTIKVGTDARAHELVISDRGCGTVREKASAYEDDVRLCSVPTPTGVALQIEGMTRTDSTEYRHKSEILIARHGASVEVGRTGGVRFAIKTL